MTRIALFLPLALAACASEPAPLPPPPPDAEVRPVVANDSLQGHWTIASVNGRPGNGMWLELGAEGLGTVTRAGTALFAASPVPQSRAFLGCNSWRPNGWTRNGDKLTFGVEMSSITERGCDPETMALEEQAYAILRKTMTMELAPPGRLRLVSEEGTLELVREGS